MQEVGKITNGSLGVLGSDIGWLQNLSISSRNYPAHPTKNVSTSKTMMAKKQDVLRKFIDQKGLVGHWCNMNLESDSLMGRSLILNPEGPREPWSCSEILVCFS